MVVLKGKDFLTLAELDKNEIYFLLSRALEYKDLYYSGIWHRHLEGKTVALIFEKPSTRTRVSFEAGIFQLGGYPLFLKGEDLQLERGEPIEDMGKVLSRYVDAIVIRTFAQKTVEELAKAASVPVINGLTDEFHPCQVLADLVTIFEKKERLAGLRLAYVGDGNNVASSLLIGAAKTGLNISIATPKGYEIPEKVVKIALSEVREVTHKVVLTNDPVKAVKNADIVYTDVWTSMGKEEEKEERLKVFKPYQVNKALLAYAKPDCLIMHCLPAHRGEEITSDVMEDERCVIFDQAENRLHAQKALLVSLIGERE